MTRRSLLPAGDGWTPVQRGESGDEVYVHKDGAAYAKRAHGPRAGLLESERRRIEWLAPFGLGTPAILDWTQCRDEACLILSTVPGVPASTLPSEKLSEAWPSIAQKLKELHALPVKDCPFRRDLDSMMARARDVVLRNAVNPDFLAPEDRDIPAAKLLSRLEAQMPGMIERERHDLVVCHGDACLPNIMVDPESLRVIGFIDLGRLGLADRYADFALLIANSAESWAGPAETKDAFDLLFTILGIAFPDRERLAFYLRLDPLTWG